MSHPLLSRLALTLSSRGPAYTKVRPVEQPCRQLLARSMSILQTLDYRSKSFSTTTCLYKKAGKANLSNARSDSSPPVSGQTKRTPVDDAFDVSNLEAQILKAIEKLTHDLSQLRSGGKMNPEVIEGLKVKLGSAGKDGHGKEIVKLGDVAQVVPRGRMFNIIAGEAEHIKSLMSAIAASNHSLTPLAPEASAPLTIQVPLPPPTGETRRAAAEAATKFADHATRSIQSSRQTHHKNLRNSSMDRSVRADDVRKATKRMEEVVKKGLEDVKRIVDGAKKAIES